MRDFSDVSELAAALADAPGLPERLVTEHVDRGDGRCERCGVGNQAGQQPWPCTIYAAAARAAEFLDIGLPDEPET